jgi:hypothetical protein
MSLQVLGLLQVLAGLGLAVDALHLGAELGELLALGGVGGGRRGAGGGLDEVELAGGVGVEAVGLDAGGGLDGGAHELHQLLVGLGGGLLVGVGDVGVLLPLGLARGDQEGAQVTVDLVDEVLGDGVRDAGGLLGLVGLLGAGLGLRDLGGGLLGVAFLGVAGGRLAAEEEQQGGQRSEGLGAEHAAEATPKARRLSAAFLPAVRGHVWVRVEVSRTRRRRSWFRRRRGRSRDRR